MEFNTKTKRYTLLAGTLLTMVLAAHAVSADETAVSGTVIPDQTSLISEKTTETSEVAPSQVASEQSDAETVTTSTASSAPIESPESSSEVTVAALPSPESVDKLVIETPKPRVLAARRVVEETPAESPVEEEAPTLSYSSTVQDKGWQEEVGAGETSGTTGESKAIQGIKITLDSSIAGDVSYKTQLQTYGWQDAVTSGQVSGRPDKNKRVEAIAISLTGDISSLYDVYYRTHIQTLGWLGWAKNGESAGSEGLFKRLEAYEVKLVKKGDLFDVGTTQAFYKLTRPTLTYQGHIQGPGWQKVVKEGQLAGTERRAKRLEGLKIFLTGNGAKLGGIQYRGYVSKTGWQGYVTSGQLAGTERKAKRMEAVQIKLTGILAERYSIAYRAHIQGKGWLGWVKDGAIAGTTGKNKRLEGIEIKLVKKVTSAKKSATTTSASQGNYKQLNKVIYLDAGHGGYDSGASYYGKYEKNLTLQMQQLVKAGLQQSGYTVVTTRDTDTFVDLLDRSKKVNKSKADIFVSLHFNASAPSANGIETYYYEYYSDYQPAINKTYHNNAERLTRSSQLASAIQRETVAKTGAKNLGVKRNTFAVLRETTAPAVLVELGFISNATENRKISTRAYQEKLANGVIDGIKKYYKTHTV